jgi:CRP/FNR family cyclic AMP-dependent transcriptional regulator
MAKTDPVLAMLSKVDLFEALSTADLRRVRVAGKELQFPAGEELTVQGKPGGRFFLILDGEVEISVGGRRLRTFGPGDYLGEISVIDGEPRSASAVATTPVSTWSLASWNFRPLLRTYPSVAEKIMLLLCKRLRDAEAALASTR